MMKNLIKVIVLLIIFNVLASDGVNFAGEKDLPIILKTNTVSESEKENISSL